jgi:hypothetical protein
VSPAHRCRRGDGTVLSGTDLTEAVPMLPHELDDLVRLVDLVEEWLRFDDVAGDLFTDWLIAACADPDRDPTVQDVIDALGATSVKLHRILRAAVPDTGHRNPPTS